MSFSPPVFNLSCDIYRGPWLTKSFALASPCNLAYGRRITIEFANESAEVLAGCNMMQVLLPAGVDVRSLVNAPANDIIECPIGSGRWYGVVGVDDAGKGFDNEHRIAQVIQIGENFSGTLYPGLIWPAPMP